MMERQDEFPQDCDALYSSLNAHWRKLCNYYLPVAPVGSIWRYSREALADEREQGWKLHVAATVHTAGNVLKAVGPFLSARRAMYKAPASIYELYKLNSGLLYGYSQVGKFLTVYPPTDEDAVLIARALHRATRRMSAPAVPFDSPYRQNGCVYYRYGAFKVLELEDPHGDRVYAMRDSRGLLVPDTRNARTNPEWAPDPFLSRGGRRPPQPVKTPLRTTFKAFRALAQRGRGGVYEALDLSVTPPRICILKEGRKAGEVAWDGRDGCWRVKHEGAVLTALQQAGINVPCLYSSFEAEGNHYLAMELIEGETLNQWLGRKKRRVAISVVLSYGLATARLLARLHSVGWIWRDCKPGNLILTKDGGLRPIDFEGACPLAKPDPFPWGTRSYVPPEWSDPFTGQSRQPEDLYALGAIIYFLLAGRPPDESDPSPVERLRRNVPAELGRVVAALLAPDPRRRPGARTVARRLKAIPDSVGMRRSSALSRETRTPKEATESNRRRDGFRSATSTLAH